jgi:hypothetical protein
MKYKISFAIDGRGLSTVIAAESQGEAMEHFELWADGQDCDIELVSVCEAEA